MKKNYSIEDKKVVISIRLNGYQLYNLEHRRKEFNKNNCSYLNRSEYILYLLNLLWLNKFDFSVANITERREAIKRRKINKI